MYLIHNKKKRQRCIFTEVLFDRRQVFDERFIVVDVKIDFRCNISIQFRQ